MTQFKMVMKKKNIVPESLLVKAKVKYQGGKWVEGYYAFMDPDHIVTSKDGRTLYFVDQQLWNL